VSHQLTLPPAAAAADPVTAEAPPPTMKTTTEAERHAARRAWLTSADVAATVHPARGEGGEGER
jgi:hypothetical protein